MENEHLLVVNNLRTSFEVPAGEVRSVAGISFSLEKGKILGIVGESGSGKSVTAASLMQILVAPGHIKEGSSIVFEGEELVGMKEKDLREIRGDSIAMIFQDPMTALNPVFTIGHQMEEAVLLHNEGFVEKAIASEKKAVRDDVTQINRLSVEERSLGKDPAKATDLTLIQEKKGALQAQLRKDEADLRVAKEKAEADYAQAQKAENVRYRYESHKLLGAFLNAIRGGFAEKFNEAARYQNEKDDALRYLPMREKQKAALKKGEELAALLKEKAEALRPVCEKAAARPLSSNDKAACLKAKQDIETAYAGKIEALQEEERALEAEANALEKQNLASLAVMHKARKQALKKSRKETIRSSWNAYWEASAKHRSAFQETHYSASKKAIEMLTLVGINNPEKRMAQYPFEFSGGMLQRVMIAMALLSKPDLLIADEPTTALDVTIQAQILELIKNIQKKLGMGVIIITHDLGVVAQICDEVDVMYAGRIVERGTVAEIFYNPQHEYTKGLLASIPGADAKKGSKLHPIEGNPVDVFALPDGCSFAPRCEKCLEICLKRYPAERKVNEEHLCSCFLSATNALKAGKLSKEQFVDYLNQSFAITPNKGKEEKPHGH